MEKLNDYIKQLKGGYDPEYFPNNNDKIKIDEVGKYSISKPHLTKQLIKLIKQKVGANISITDGTASVGGDTLAFSEAFNTVNSVELDKTRFEYLKHNMNIFNRTNITFYNDSYLNVYKNLKQDVIYLDPPWGGLDYKNSEKLVFKLGDMKLEDLCDDIMKNKLCKLLILKLPYNYDLDTFKHKLSVYKIKRVLFVFIKN